jgi:hypothetical protein
MPIGIGIGICIQIETIQQNNSQHEFERKIKSRQFERNIPGDDIVRSDRKKIEKIE